MGMYTRLEMKVRLIDNIPESYLNILRFMIGEIEEEPEFIPNHKLFKLEGDRWEFMLIGKSAYFETGGTYLKYDDTCKELYVCFSIKNYQNEIQYFIDWIAPFSINSYDEFIGSYLYEECGSSREVSFSEFLIGNEPKNISLSEPGMIKDVVCPLQEYEKMTWESKRLNDFDFMYKFLKLKRDSFKMAKGLGKYVLWRESWVHSDLGRAT